jgi:hypothetical protein
MITLIFFSGIAECRAGLRIALILFSEIQQSNQSTVQMTAGHRVILHLPDGLTVFLECSPCIQVCRVEQLLGCQWRAGSA